MAANDNQAAGPRLSFGPARATRHHLEEIVYGLNYMLAPVTRDGHNTLDPEDFLTGGSTGVLLQQRTFVRVLGSCTTDRARETHTCT